MIEVDPQKRYSLADVFRHPWVAGNSKTEPELELPMAQVVQVTLRRLLLVVVAVIKSDYTLCHTCRFKKCINVCGRFGSFLQNL
uniref:Protein kinase domain-containing protein n=1 Tax=Parascaris equorum TaxID=6256 RepID=A0A914RHL1_PAREQ